MKKLVIFSLIFFLIQHNTQGQDSLFAKKMCDTLSSKSFFGRGYINDGHKKASAFIAKEFKSYKLKSFEKNNYFQYFPIEFNTFPSISLSINGKQLTEGRDYIVSPESRTAKGTFETMAVDTNHVEMPLRYANKCAVFDFENHNNKKISALYNDLKVIQQTSNTPTMEIKDKLTWWIRPVQTPFGDSKPHFIVKRSVFNELDSLKSIEYNIKSKILVDKSQNIIGFVEGTTFPDSFLVIAAHYDHLGMLGNAVFYGANDNASGVAMLLDLAKTYSKKPAKYSVVFMAFGGEEAGLLGSKYFVEQALFPLKNIKFLVNLDLLGTGEDGLMVVNGTAHNTLFKRLETINQQDSSTALKKIGKRPNAPNSDHFWFTQKGVPAFFFYAMGNYTHYHDIDDKAVAMTEYNKIFRLIDTFIRSF